VTLTEAAQQLQASENYRVLRRVPPVSAWNLQPATGEVVRACIVDTETTGTGSDAEVVELAILPFDYCRETGGVVAVHEGFSALRQPSKPIPAEATAIHGITDEMAAGCSISEEQVAAAVGGAKVLLAHSAKFDRTVAVKTWPVLDPIPWGCTWDDIDWRAGGYESGKLAYLLMCMGYFFSGHRALPDCFATLFLLTQPLGEHSALFALLQRLREPLYKVTVRNTRYETKDLLKARRYQWNGDDKSWWKTTADVTDEMRWFGESKLDGTLYTEKLAAVERHRVAT